MTKIEGVPDSSEAKPGMAFYAGSGPQGKTCDDCIHRGYRRESQRGHWSQAAGREVFKTYRVRSCAQFKKLTGMHGMPVEDDYAACKYFEQKSAR